MGRAYDKTDWGEVKILWLFVMVVFYIGDIKSEDRLCGGKDRQLLLKNCRFDIHVYGWE
jgi:hypothetical protein